MVSALEDRPVVPAVRSFGAEFDRALAGDHAAVFVLGGSAYDLVERLRRVSRRPAICVNVDLVGGVSSDLDGIRFLSRHVEGVISTHRRVVEVAGQAGMVTIQRLFAIDSGAVERGLKTMARAAPGFVEILPALAYPEIAGRYREVCGMPALAGGLVTEPVQVSALLEAGASGVSTSSEHLWSHDLHR